MNTKPESFREKFFSFQGRLGRERTAILSIWLCALGIIPILSISAVSLSDSQILVFVSCLVFFIPFIISGLSLMTRRFHDLGHSGWLYLVFIVIATLAGLVVYILKTMTVFYIISFPATILGLYLWVWPGQFQENKYGMPPRGMDRKFQDQKEKFEKEFTVSKEEEKKYNELISLVLNNEFLKENGTFVLEHQSKMKLEHPNLTETRKYGNVSFSFFSSEMRVPSSEV